MGNIITGRVAGSPLSPEELARRQEHMWDHIHAINLSEQRKETIALMDELIASAA